jgi:hypothetical protein
MENYYLERLSSNVYFVIEPFTIRGNLQIYVRKDVPDRIPFNIGGYDYYD